MWQTKEIIKQVRKIEISTKQLVDGLITGNYHSIFKGQGIEFSEIREYTTGDDIRFIDWNVTERLNHPFVKEFIEERDLRVYFAFDMSGSGLFGNKIEKRRKAIELTAALMFSALRNNDNIGLFLFTNSVEKFIPARKGRRHVLKILSTLVSFNPKSKMTDLGKSLAYISKVIKKQSILFIISDFYADDFAKPLKILKNRHDIIAIKIADKREKEIPNVGFIELEDEETGEQILVDTSDKKFRENYSKLVSENEKKIKSQLKKIKVDIVEILTDEPYDIPLKKFFNIRKRRVVY
jgi:uncharacterized protein (DUF58 family)